MDHQPYVNTESYLRIREYARQMRKNPTMAEQVFWEKVRNRGLFGLKINRQYILQCVLETGYVKYYIADFHCCLLQLIFELDGHIHLKQQDEDMIRTEYLEELGYQVIRFSNDQVLYRWHEVEARIKEELLKRGISCSI